jgi:antitoxin ParD1/3/4
MQTSLNISLPGPLRSWVERQVQLKGYGTAGEYVRDVLRRAQREERAIRTRVDQKLEEALGAGAFLPLDRNEWRLIRRDARRVGSSSRPR